MLILKILRTLDEYELSSIASKHHLGWQELPHSKCNGDVILSKKNMLGKKKQKKTETAAFRVRR